MQHRSKSPMIMFDTTNQRKATMKGIRRSVISASDAKRKSVDLSPISPKFDTAPTFNQETKIQAVRASEQDRTTGMSVSGDEEIPQHEKYSRIMLP